MYFIIFFKATTKQAPTWMAPDVDTTLKLGLGLNIGVDLADRAVDAGMSYVRYQVCKLKSRFNAQYPVPYVPDSGCIDGDFELRLPVDVLAKGWLSFIPEPRVFVFLTLNSLLSIFY